MSGTQNSREFPLKVLGLHELAYVFLDPSRQLTCALITYLIYCHVSPILTEKCVTEERKDGAYIFTYSSYVDQVMNGFHFRRQGERENGKKKGCQFFEEK